MSDIPDFTVEPEDREGARDNAPLPVPPPYERPANKRGKKGDKTSPKMIETAIRRDYVLRMRLSGSTYRQIAEGCIQQFGRDRLPKGYDDLYAAKDVMRELDRLNEGITESASQLRFIEVARVDRMTAAIWSRAIGGELSAIDRVMKLQERRARYVRGLELPKQIAPVNPDGDEPWEGGNTILYLPDNGRGDGDTDPVVLDDTDEEPIELD